MIGARTNRNTEYSYAGVHVTSDKARDRPALIIRFYSIISPLPARTFGLHRRHSSVSGIHSLDHSILSNGIACLESSCTGNFFNHVRMKDGSCIRDYFLSARFDKGRPRSAGFASNVRFV